MQNKVNRFFELQKRPSGLPDASTWELRSETLSQPEPGTLLIRNEFISLDPAMRGWMNEGRSYIPPVAIGEVMRAGTVGRVVTSHHQDFQEGDVVVGMGGVQDYVITDGKGWTKVQAGDIPLPRFLGALGMTGYTAYFGLIRVGRPKAGDCLLVSGAAGAVGSVVGQIGRILGCRTVGIAGGPEKCRYVVEELGFDACIDYKNEDVRKALKEHCPEGIDIYFDNVGGQILDLALSRLARHARIVICGAISQYNATISIQGPANYLSLLVNRARMEGFVVFDYQTEYPTAATDIAGWIQSGKLTSREEIHEGLERFPEIFLKLFSGDKIGKLILKP